MRLQALVHNHTAHGALENQACQKGLVALADLLNAVKQHKLHSTEFTFPFLMLRTTTPRVNTLGTFTGQACYILSKQHVSRQVKPK